jgi:hypothetical protein
LYTCSFVTYLVKGVGLQALIDLFSVAPTDVRLDRLGGKTLATWRREWLRAVKLE